MNPLGFEPLEGRQLLTSLSSPHVKSFNNPDYAISAQISPANDPSGSGHVFQSAISVNGQAQPYSTVWLAQGPRGYFTNVAQADSSGNYSFNAQVPKGQSEIRVFAKNTSSQYSNVTKLEVIRANPIVSWDSVALRAIQNASLSAPEASRSLAIVHLAQYDAVAAVQFPKGAYSVQVAAPKGASADLAASAAARTVLVALFPSQSNYFNQVMDQVVAGSPKKAATQNGIELGDKVARATLATRLEDGSAVESNHAPSALPGLWRPTPPEDASALLPAWGAVKPFVLSSGSQFRPDAPPAVGSNLYDQALAQVTSLGQDSSSTRTTDQSDAARNWSDGPGTITNPGHWNKIAEDLALTRKGSLGRDARLFAMLDVAMADAGIAAFDAKYAFSTWRPISAIQQTDPTWTPYLNTPATPSYVSDHAAFGSAAAQVLSTVFGAKTSFTDTLYASTGAQRKFPSFAAAALENGQSGIWAGNSFSYDVQQGMSVGDKVGGFVVTRFPKAR
ncbi:vanadium-dependent haloperoxidase [Tundrisphaera lichenicola]|uniref:vanadium-dependent haloperoxidase n=1 Tax=Tundrisphaera lichenicola TaxID=2029860 RepID=UPI003EBBC40D